MRYITVNLTEILARNVVFTDRTDEIVEYLFRKAANQNVKKWITNNIVKKILQNEYDGDFITSTNELSEKEKLKADPKKSGWLAKLSHSNPIYKIDVSQNDRTKWEHWVDYLNTLKGNINFGYQNIDEKIEKWEEELHKEEKKKNEKEKIKEYSQIEEDGIEDVHNYSNGFKWVKVFGERSLDREGKLMQHCVGSYYDEVKNEDSEIYSLRDKANFPHCTIEFNPDGREISQIKGFKNTTVSPKYIPYVQDFLNKKYVNYKKVDLDESGLIKTKDKLYSIYSLPDGLKIKGDLNLNKKSVTTLPNSLTISGDLNLKETKITKLPNGLKVGKNLFIEDGVRLPNDIKVSGLIITNTKILNASNDGTTCRGSLNLSRSNIKKLPDNFHVMGDLDLSNTKNIKYLPEGLKVNGNLKLKFSNILSIPKDLQVGNSLNLTHSKILELPEGLKIKGGLDLSYTHITELPKDLEVLGSLNLSNSSIKELPNNFSVGKDLDISSTTIKKLPHGLKIGGSLTWQDATITELPEDIQVAGSINLSNSRVYKIPVNLKINRTLYLYKVRIAELPDNFHIEGSLDLGRSTLTELPDNLQIDGSLDISRTAITKLPDNLRVGKSLILTDTPITKIPEGLKIGGQIIR